MVCFPGPRPFTRHHWPGFIQVERAARRHAATGCGAGLLYFHCLLSGLGRHFFVRKSVFCFADPVIHSWAERFSAARGCIVSRSTRCRGDLVTDAGFVCNLERGIHVSVGRALDSAARENLLEPYDSQPVPDGASANRRALERLSFSSQDLMRRIEDRDIDQLKKQSEP